MKVILNYSLTDYEMIYFVTSCFPNTVKNESFIWIFVQGFIAASEKGNEPQSGNDAAFFRLGESRLQEKKREKETQGIIWTFELRFGQIYTTNTKRRNVKEMRRRAEIEKCKHWEIWEQRYITKAVNLRRKLDVTTEAHATGEPGMYLDLFSYT